MSDLLSQYVACPPPLVQPDYNIYRYTDSLYKIVHIKNPRPLIRGPRRVKVRTDDEPIKKSDCNLSRARRTILELALCNNWHYFATFTLDKMKYDRYDLASFKKDLTQFIRDQRKKSKKNGHDLAIPFLIVPECHKNGAWHCHALFGDISPLLVSFKDERRAGMDLPDYLVTNDFYDWPDYRKKFGFCSFGLIRNQVAASFYITKYISKDLITQGGLHTYIPSRGLNRASCQSQIYGKTDAFDKWLVNDYQFVKTGMTAVSDGLDWTFGFELDYRLIREMQNWKQFDYSSADPYDQSSLDSYFNYIQTAMDGF